MAEVKHDRLVEELKAVGLELTEEQSAKLLRVWRKIEIPDGCPDCGQHVLVGVTRGKRLFSACCNTKIG